MADWRSFLNERMWTLMTSYKRKHRSNGTLKSIKRICDTPDSAAILALRHYRGCNISDSIAIVTVWLCCQHVCWTVDWRAMIVLQEFIAYGMSSFIGSFFHCFASAVSLSRSSVLVGVGGKTRVRQIAKKYYTSASSLSARDNALKCYRCLRGI